MGLDEELKKKDERIKKLEAKLAAQEKVEEAKIDKIPAGTESDIPEKPKEDEEKKVENKNPKCTNCDTDKRMSVRQVETDRDGRVTADIFSCAICHSWVGVPRIETKEDEITRLKKRLALIE